MAWSEAAGRRNEMVRLLSIGRRKTTKEGRKEQKRTEKEQEKKKKAQE